MSTLKADTLQAKTTNGTLTLANNGTGKVELPSDTTIGDQTYTPVWTSSGTAPAIGNGTITGRYHVINGLCTLKIDVVFGSTSTYGSGEYRFSVPVAAVAGSSGAAGVGSCWVNDTGTGYAQGFAVIRNATAYCQVNFDFGTISATAMSATVPTTFTTGDGVTITLVYEV